MITLSFASAFQTLSFAAPVYALLSIDSVRSKIRYKPNEDPLRMNMRECWWFKDKLSKQKFCHEYSERNCDLSDSSGIRRVWLIKLRIF